MNLIKNFITTSAIEWSNREKQKGNSLAGFIIKHMEQENKLRDAQLEAVKVYLWLKCEANNKTLDTLIEEQYSDEEGTKLKTFLIKLADEIASDNLKRYAKSANDQEIKKFLTAFIGGYDGIATWLFSLPMGAGKTFVMAAMIYIDLYFNLTSEDKRFAKNFLIFAPSGLKNSVIPSLRSIEHFDPTWILPTRITEQIKKQLNFVVLDVNKNEKKSNRIENPNARKVQQCLTQQNPYGNILVTNAEKVILDRVVEDQYDKLPLLELKADEKNRKANELRHLLGKIPSLTILMDEVHHNQKEEGKLRTVIDKHFTKNTTSIIGFTGTPYFKRKLSINSITLTLDQIPNTVYHYELKNGIRNFLKQPLIKSFTSNTETIVKASLEDFYNRYYKSTYKDNRKPKLAIYCATIEKLEEQVLPIVTEFYTQKGLDVNEILKYYGTSIKATTGKKYALGKDAEVEFNKLDKPYSNKRIILLCQIGKEGWDCQSLTGVVLSGEGDSPKNMVLQTTCRCLREVDDAKTEIGLIYLNEDNKKHLEKELQDTHKISIKEFEEGSQEIPALKRVDRRAYLQLPPLIYKQFMVEYECTSSAQSPNTEEILQELTTKLKKKEQPFYNPQITTIRTGFEVSDTSNTTINTLKLSTTPFSYTMFTNEILKSAFGAIADEAIKGHTSLLKTIHSTVTQFGNYVEGFDLSVILSTIHQAFIPVSEVRVHETIDNRSVAWLVSDINKNALSEKAKIYPENKDFITKIQEYDSAQIKPETLTVAEDAKIKQLEDTKNLMSGNRELVKTLDEQIHTMQRSKLPIKYKNKSFHYIPYDFTQSNFERDVLEKIFQLDAFQNQHLEVYFNGDRFLSTFKIKIYKRSNGNWKLIQDKYTPDFLIIKRNKKNVIEKTLIIETKGAHLSQDFSDIRNFMQGKFIEINPGLFDFLYLQDGKPFDYQVQQISDKMQEYFR